MDEELYIDSDGFVCFAGMRLPMRIDAARGVLVFVDKDKRRSADRGTRFVDIEVSDFALLLLAIQPAGSEDSSSAGSDQLTLLRE